MCSYLDTITKRFRYNRLLAILLLRGFYGIVTGTTLYITLSNNGPLISMLSNIFSHYYPYLVWIYLVVLYPISVIFIKLLLGVKEKFDLYLRGFTIYFALAVLTYSVLATT